MNTLDTVIVVSIYATLRAANGQPARETMVDERAFKSVHGAAIFAAGLDAGMTVTMREETFATLAAAYADTVRHARTAGVRVDAPSPSDSLRKCADACKAIVTRSRTAGVGERAETEAVRDRARRIGRLMADLAD